MKECLLQCSCRALQRAGNASGRSVVKEDKHKSVYEIVLREPVAGLQQLGLAPQVIPSELQLSLLMPRLFPGTCIPR